VAGGRRAAGVPERVMVVRCAGLCAPGAAPSPSQAAARLSERVVGAVTELCPRVEVLEPGVCAFAARGPARYFGGETVVARKIVAAVAALGVDCRVGIADGVFAAGLAAGLAAGEPAPAGAAGAGDTAGAGPVLLVPPGGSPEFLGRQPVTVLDDPDLAGLLRRLGIRTLGDLAALGERDMASRFGSAGERAHRLASGHDPRPLAAGSPPEDLSVSQEFDPPETSAEPLVFAAKALAEQLHARLRARGMTCVRVEVHARWADGRENTRLWRHDGLLTAVQVADRVRWQLDGWRAEGGGEAEGTEVGGIVLLRLAPDQVIRATGQQLALWGESVVSDRVARAALRVQALLGHEAVLRPVLEGGRNVSEQVTHLAFGEERDVSRSREQPWPGQIPGAAPALVFPVPREATVTDEDGGAVTVSGRCVLSAPPRLLAVAGEAKRAVTAWAGPWPLAERWWDPEQASRRARFQLVTDDGRAWLAAVSAGRWQIEAGYW
jgi:protein ImuB